MSAIQVLNLFLNPYAGRANRQQFLFFLLIYVISLYLAAKYGTDEDHRHTSLIFGYAGLWFLFIGFNRRFKDVDIDLSEKLANYRAKAMGYFILAFLIGFGLLFLFSWVFFGYDTSVSVTLLSALLLGTSYFCSSRHPGYYSASICRSDYGSYWLTLFFVSLVALVLSAIPLYLPNNRSPNKYGPPPVGFDLRTMLAATYPAHLLKAQEEEGEAV